MADVHYTGNCLGGGVRYTLSAEPGPIEVCYCQMCRKASDGPLATNAPVAAAEFRVTAGIVCSLPTSHLRRRAELFAPNATHHSTVSNSPVPRCSGSAWARSVSR
jgi:hypothetical protein